MIKINDHRTLFLQNSDGHASSLNPEVHTQHNACNCASYKTSLTNKNNVLKLQKGSSFC